MTLIQERLSPGSFTRTGHRGARGLAPENTLAGFRCGAEIGVDMLELDVQLSADGEVVVIHDPTLDRTTDGTGEVAALPYAALAELDAGYHFSPDGGESFPFRGQGIGLPLLSQVLEEFPAHLVTVELKPSPVDGLIPRVAELVRKQAPGRVLMASAHHGLLSHMRREAPELPTSCSEKEVRNAYLLSWVGLTRLLFRSPAVVLQMPLFSDHERDRGLTLVTPGLLRAVHAQGRLVHVWTINDPAVMRSLLALGVDGITTDRPDVLNEVLLDPAG